MKSISKFKVLVAALAGVFAWSASAAVAELQEFDRGFTNEVATTLNGVTHRYIGHGHVISDDLVLDNTTYLRLKGGTKSAPDTLSFGPADGSAVNQHPVVTIQGNSGFYATYRNGTAAFLDDPADKSAEPSYLTVNVGENGGSGKFVVKTVGKSFSSNISPAGLWLWQLTVNENATSECDYVDILQLDPDGVADIDCIVVNSDKPARIIFNGGKFRDSQQTRGSENPFQPSEGKELMLEGINGKDINYEKSYHSHALNGGKGTLRIQGDCNFVYTEVGETLRSNRLALQFGKSDCGQTVWDITGDFILGQRAWAQCLSNDALPTNIVIRMRSNAILDPNGKTLHLRSLICESENEMVTNVTSASGSTLVFGADGRDCVFSARCTTNISVEKVGAGTLTITGATFEEGSKLTLKAGTTIIDEVIYETLMGREGALTVEEGAIVVLAKVVTVASGTTTPDATLYADGEFKRAIIKKGAGTLVLSNPANSFSGGLVIDEGIVKVTAAGAQGVGKITVNSTSTKTCQIMFAAVPPTPSTEVVFTNDIVVTGKSTEYGSGGTVTFNYAAINLAQTNQVLTGTITAHDDLYVRDGFDNQNLSGIKISGDVNVAGHILYVSSGTIQYWSGKVTAAEVWLPYNSSYRGRWHLAGTENEIGKFMLFAKSTTCKTIIESAGGADGAIVQFNDHNTDGQALIRGTFEPKGDTTVKSLAGDDYLRAAGYDANNIYREADTDYMSGYSINCNMGDTICTLTISGRDDVDSTKYCGGIFHKNMSLTLDARDGFTQVFSNVMCNSTKELKVKGGTLVLAGKTYFPDLTTLTVEGTGRLVICGEIGGITNPDDKGFSKLTEINIASTAKIKLAEGIELTAATVKVDGFQLNADTYSTGYSAATLPWIEGAGTIKATSSPTPPVTAVDAVWSGGAGANASTATAANWKDTPPPAFYYLGYRPVFGEGGSEAVFPAGTSYLNGILFNRAGDFTVSGAEGAKLKLYSGITADNAADADTLYTYDIAAQVESAAASLAFAVPTNRTLRTSGGIAPAEGVAKTDLAKTGLGTLELVDARVAGDLTANTADCGVLKLSGDIGVEGDSGKLSYRNYNYTQVPGTSPAKWYATYCGYLHLDNATVHKPFNFQSGGQVSCTNGNNASTWLTCTEGTTNIFKGKVTHAGSSVWALDSNATIVFEGGYADPGATGGGSFNPGMKAGCTNGVMVFNGPIMLLNKGKGTLGASSQDNAGLTIVLGASSNVVVNSFTLNYYKTVCTADDAFVGVKRTILHGNVATFPTTLDLTTTYQRFEDIHVNNGNGVITGEYPATIDFTSVTNETFAKDGNHNFCPQILSGWVKLAMSGTGYQIVGQNGKGFASQSYGDIEVSNGTLELMPQTTWLNGTNFIAKGEGKLKLSATNNKPQVGPQAVFHFAESGTVEIPSGVTVSVSAAFVGETQIGAGTYSAATVEGPMAGRVTGGGKLRVRSGMMLILR